MFCVAKVDLDDVPMSKKVPVKKLRQLEKRPGLTCLEVIRLVFSGGKGTVSEEGTGNDDMLIVVAIQTQEYCVLYKDSSVEACSLEFVLES